jgi:3-hydroxyacyl-[acyl-carrier-protein] dehydratase
MSDFGINFILKCQRNRYPLLFIDEIVSLEPGVSATTRKNFTYNEWFFPPHFEGNPNVPGFVQVEAMAQSLLMTFLSLEKYQGKETAFVSIQETYFHRKIVPGESLEMVAKLESFRFGIAQGRVEGSVAGQTACSAALRIAIPDVVKSLQPSLRTILE